MMSVNDRKESVKRAQDKAHDSSECPALKNMHTPRPYLCGLASAAALVCYVRLARVALYLIAARNYVYTSAMRFTTWRAGSTRAGETSINRR